ncbi:hypothetical protein CN367_02490 [Priestia megaterium]|nr:hypothetical protein CN435_23310 [Priestia megaterium]PEZ50568.1 hypothetical protein CN367_02490 [Priestia megaterium]PFL60147.1 hypothetical protein COJ36_28190 [Priestia megaterium]PFP08767.1 hypothetical protein COJ92_29725 [Priestia megaterium]PFU67538.1 hypothetical protein COK90_00240 [Priestia megaterium]
MEIVSNNLRHLAYSQSTGSRFFMFLDYCGEIGKEVARKCISNLLVAFDSNTLMHEKIES